MDDLYTIDTPENIEFAYDIAGIGSRFLAAIIDTFLIIVAEGIVFFAAGAITNFTALGEQVSRLESVVAALAGLLAFVILWGYYIIFELVWNGQSPGKRVVGLRRCARGGRPVTFLSAATRNLVRLIDFLPAFYGIGVIVMFIDPRARRLGDFAAGTLVVRERRSVTLESLTATTGASIPQAQPDQARLPTLEHVHLLTIRPNRQSLYMAAT